MIPTILTEDSNKHLYFQVIFLEGSFCWLLFKLCDLHVQTCKSCKHVYWLVLNFLCASFFFFSKVMRTFLFVFVYFLEEHFNPKILSPHTSKLESFFLYPVPLSPIRTVQCYTLPRLNLTTDRTLYYFSSICMSI